MARYTPVFAETLFQINEKSEVCLTMNRGCMCLYVCMHIIAGRNGPRNERHSDDDDFDAYKFLEGSEDEEEPVVKVRRRARDETDRQK